MQKKELGMTTFDVVLREYVAMKWSTKFLRLITTCDDFQLTLEDLVKLFVTFGYRKREDNIAKKFIGAQEGKDHKLIHEVRGKRGGRAKNHISLSRDYFKQLAISFSRNLCQSG